MIRITLAIFLLSYIRVADRYPTDVLTQVPSNMIIGKVRPSYYICLVTSLWGVLSMSQGFTKNFAQLASVRFILGLVEGMFVVGTFNV